ncbi:MAG TPA: hypothetical protein VHR97_02715 [Candidatus Baltobacteraceae bacterium]|jgi:hypothetical protein|nr:hypothetical protein [Candidatus Baltobacteraceae bacterium]
MAISRLDRLENRIRLIEDELLEAVVRGDLRQETFSRLIISVEAERGDEIERTEEVAASSNGSH